jgi:hypothetical protein
MDNLTIDQQILKTHIGVKPVEAHTVVVLEKTEGSGEEFRFEIEPGQTAPKTGLDIFQWLRGRRSDRYFAYAVTDDPQRTTFSTDVVLRTRIHTLALRITLAYHVSEPKQLVFRRNDDPVRKVRQEIADLTRVEFAELEWIDVLVDFAAVARQVVGKAAGKLSNFAATYGLTIDGIVLEHTLAPEEIRRLRAVEEAELLKEQTVRQAQQDRLVVGEKAATAAVQVEKDSALALLKQKKDQMLETDRLNYLLDSRENAVTAAEYKELDELRSAGHRAIAGAFGTVAATVQAHKDLPQAVSAIRAAAGMSGPATAGPALRSAVTPQMLGSGDTGATIVITEMLTATGQIGLDLSERHRLQSSVLHLIAELMLHGERSPAIVDDYLERVRKIRATMENLEHLDFLEKFINADALARKLR